MLINSRDLLVNIRVERFRCGIVIIVEGLGHHGELTLIYLTLCLEQHWQRIC